MGTLKRGPIIGDQPGLGRHMPIANAETPVASQHPKAAVDETNKRRDQWVRLHWERDRRAHENYDLSVNTERFGIQGAADLIVTAARKRFGFRIDRVE